MNGKANLAPLYAAAIAALLGGCVTVQGGDKPIKIDVTVTHKIDRELEQFYAFEKKYEQPTTMPATQPKTTSSSDAD